jgi:hypothetical protein
MLKPVVFGALLIFLVLHFIAGTVFDFTTFLVLACLYLLIVGSWGLEAARLSGTGGDIRRQERLAEDALRRGGRLQSLLEPGSAADDVVNRILASGSDPRRMVIVAGNEVEDALRAVYQHYSESERTAGTSNGTDLPLSFLVQELIWRGLLSPDIYDTAEPILALRDMAYEPRTRVEGRTATDVARATQAVVLRVQSLGIEIHPRRTPLAWMRTDVPAETAPNRAIPEVKPEDGLVMGGEIEPEDGLVIDGDHLVEDEPESEPDETRPATEVHIQQAGTGDVRG